MRDVSCGGLSVESVGSADQGDSVRVRLEPPGAAPIEIQALVWNVRTGRSKTTGTAMSRLGLVLSEAPAEFETLVRGRMPRETQMPSPAKPAPKKPVEALRGLPAPAPEPEDPLLRFRARVSRRGTSRTRVIMVFATCTEDAEEKALVEVGEEWSLLEIAEP